MVKEEIKQRLLFDEKGRIRGLGSKDSEDYEEFEEKIILKKSDSLQFLKDEPKRTISNIFEKSYWNLYEKENAIKPLKFSNGKTQEDVVKEIIDLIETGNKVIFLHGACGSGKSAIALNVARVLGKSSIVVPVKALQKQYEEDYLEKKYVLKPNGEKMKIAMITGKENHDSIVMDGISCADPYLPENIKITEKNYGKLIEYYKKNPFVQEEDIPLLEDIRRLSIAPSNPYWSPILPAELDFPALKKAKKYKYIGVNGKEYVFYHRQSGCSYYDQYLAYTKADTIIFNSAKFNSELIIGRKPETKVDIIDEADEYLDSLFQQEEINITRLAGALRVIQPESRETKEKIKDIIELLELEEKNKRITGVDETKVFKIRETKMESILKLISKDSELESEIILDELNYANKALEIARNFDSFDEVYATYRKDEENLFVSLVSTNLSAKFKDLLNKTKALVFMSGTLHSEEIIKNIFGIKDYKIVEAETSNFGNIEIIMTGKEFPCTYTNLNSSHARQNYLEALAQSINKTKHPTLIHVHAFKDLPSEQEKENFHLNELMSSEKLKQIQREDKLGTNVTNFKEKKAKTLFTTKCARGVDFPGKTCNSIIFTKYPNPNVSDTFWKILKETHPNYYWTFYKDKAYREFLQRIYRALRSPKDHVYILSPDIRVINAVKELQRKGIN